MNNENATGLLRASWGTFRHLLNKGYSFRELIYWGIRLKIYARVRTFVLYSFYSKGRNIEIDPSAVVQGASRISLGDGVYIQRNAWLAVPLFDLETVERRPYLKVGSYTRIGPGCTISAAREIQIGKSVLFGPNVTVLDHRHEYRDIRRPISVQGVASQGAIQIEDNAWLGANSVVVSSRGDLVIGRNSVVSANSVVRESVPPFCIVAGIPAKIVKRYNEDSGKWE